MAEDEETCGHPTADGSPCQLPASDGDSCHLNEHGGHAAPNGRPTRLTEDLMDEICACVAEGTLVKDVWAWCDVPRSTWYKWIRKGRDDVRANGEPTTPYGRFVARLARAERKARERWHRFIRDGLVRRKEVITVGEGEDADVKVVPARLDPETREKVVGEDADVYNALKYAKARWPDEFAEKHKVEHSTDERVESFLQRLRAAANGEDAEGTKEAAVVPPGGDDDYL